MIDPARRLYKIDRSGGCGDAATVIAMKQHSWGMHPLHIRSILIVLLALSVAHAYHAVAQATMPGSVSGAVICGDTSRPCRFASVLLQSIKEPASGAKPEAGLSYATNSALDGSFSLSGVQPGTYYVTGELPGYLTVVSTIPEAELKTGSAAVRAKVREMLQTVRVEANQSANVTLRLERGAAVSGTIRYDDGSPAVNVKIAIFRKQKDGSWRPAVALGPGIMGQLGIQSADDLGRFRGQGLTSGEYTVEVLLPEVAVSLPGLFGDRELGIRFIQGDALRVYYGDVFRLSKAKPLVLGAGEERNDANITIPTSGLRVIRGTVTAKRDGHAFSSGQVVLLDAEDRSEVRKTEVRTDGSFSFGSVASGSYLLRTALVQREIDGVSPSHGYGEAELPLLIESDVDNANLVVPDKSTPR